MCELSELSELSLLLFPQTSAPPGRRWWKRTPAAAFASREAVASRATHLSYRAGTRICPEAGLRLWVHSFRRKCAKSDISVISPLITYGVADPSSIFHVIGPVIRPIRPVTDGTISLPTRYGSAKVPSVIQRPCHLAWYGLRTVSGGVVFSKLSKLLNQEDALSAPCLRGDFCSPQAPSRGAGMLRTDVIRHCHIFVCDHRVITPTGADAFPVVGGRCTGRARRCKAKQGRRGKTALTCGLLTPTVVRFLGRVERGRRFLW